MCFGIPVEAVRECSAYVTIKKRCGNKPHPNLVNMVKIKTKQDSLVIITEHVTRLKTLKMAFES